MTQNNIYMDNENSEITVNVRPEAEDTVRNSAASAAASAASASVSASTASGLLESIRGIKTGAEIFVAQAIEALQDLYANITAQLSSLKDTCVQNINTAYTSAMQLIRQTEMDVLTIIRNLGTGYVNEAAEYARAAREIVDFHVSTEHLNQSKGLLTGDVSDDATVLSDVKKYAHSTFDRSKFTVVGSPVVTNDGIASGFSSGYVSIPFTLGDFSEIVFEVPKSANSTGMLASTNNIKILIWQTENGKVGFYWREPNSDTQVISQTFTVNANTTLYKFVLTSTTLKLYENGVLNDTRTVTTSGIAKNFTNIIIGDYGQQVNSFPFTGSIDLKRVNISINNVPVFSGNKTGLDVIKLNDFTEVGSPTITFDGIARGFSDSTNYLKKDLVIPANSNYIIKGRITVGTDTTSTNNIPLGVNGDGNVLLLSLRFIQTDKKVVLVARKTDATNAVIMSSNNFLTLGNTCDYEIIISGANLTFKFNNTVIGTMSDFANIATQFFTFGVDRSFLTAFLGSIDLNAFKIYVNGDLVYQPLLRIPYTESKTGSKIVDSYYRGRVNDMASQFGYAPYYTIDEDNGNFTLPMGELYGMIENLRNKINELSTQT